MSGGHGSDHEAFLERLLVGDADPGAPEARARLDACATCRQRYQQLRSLTSTLDRLAAEERGEVAASSALAAPPDAAELALVEPLRRLVGSAARPRRVPRALLAAAAVLVILPIAAVLYFGGGTRDAPGPGQVLLGLREPLPGMAPAGAVLRYGTFRADVQVPTAGSCEIVIRDRAGARLPLRIPGLERPEWTPTAEEDSALPDAIVWSLEVFDATGASRRAGDAEASRSR